jgi:hypothetical protein
MALKPEVSLQVAAATAAVVYGVFQLEVGNSLADVRNANPNNTIMKGSINTAAWTAGGVVAGISLLSKDFTVFIVGGAIAAALTWKYKHANMAHPSTGQVVMPVQNSQPSPANQTDYATS